MTEFIYFHGFASGPSSNKASVFKKEFERRNIPLKIPDLEGGDFVNLTISSQIKIAQKNMDKGPFGLIGSSMGGYLAALLAELREDVAAIYLMAPGFNFLSRWMERLNSENLDFSGETPELIKVQHFRYKKEKWLNTRIFEDAKKWETISFSRILPTRLVHGKGDETVDIQVSRKFAETHPHCQYRELDSDHGLISQINWIVKDCLEFFQNEGLVDF